MRTLLARTTPENVEALFSAISKTWYVLAGLEMLLGLGLSAVGWFAIPYVRDAAFFATEGYFFVRRKRRAVALAIPAPVIGQIALRANVVGFGFSIGGGLLYMDELLATALALRGAQVAFAYHRTRATEIHWTRVLVIVSLSILSALVVGTISLSIIFALSQVGSISSLIYSLIVIYTFIATMASLTRIYPFVRMPHPSEVSDVFA